MLTYRSTNIVFILALTGILVLDYFYPISGILYAILLLVYVFVVGCGSSFISLNFFLNAFNAGKTTAKEIAITFDDGPFEPVTPKVLDVLKKFNAPATFFLIGNRIPNNESLVKRIVQEGHLIGNHTMTHDKKFGFFPIKKVIHELEQTTALIQHVLQKKTLFFRPPFGTTNPKIKKATEQLGYDVVGWNIRSYDTVLKDEEKVLKRIKSQLAPGAIILLHDIYPFTPTLVEKLLNHVQQSGYKVVALDKLIERKAYE